MGDWVHHPRPAAARISTSPIRAANPGHAKQSWATTLPWRLTRQTSAHHFGGVCRDSALAPRDQSMHLAQVGLQGLKPMVMPCHGENARKRASRVMGSVLSLDHTLLGGLLAGAGSTSWL
jgi:hypothetical protein